MAWDDRSSASRTQCPYYLQRAFIDVSTVESSCQYGRLKPHGSICMRRSYSNLGSPTQGATVAERKFPRLLFPCDSNVVSGAVLCKAGFGKACAGCGTGLAIPSWLVGPSWPPSGLLPVPPRAMLHESHRETKEASCSHLFGPVGRGCGCTGDTHVLGMTVVGRGGPVM